MAVATAAHRPVLTGREPRAWDFVRLKLRLLCNGLRGQAMRAVALVGGIVVGLIFAGVALLGLSVSGAASRDVGFVVTVFAGTAVVLGWTLIPLLFFGVDETLDPARFALLPIRRMTLARGMLAAAFVGVPPVATLLGSAGLVIAAVIRFGWGPGVVAVVSVVSGLTLGVLASRAVTSAFAALLRSRRVRDLAAVLIALLASSVGPLQFVVSSAVAQGNAAQAVRVANVLAWTPLGAPYALPFDVAEGHLGAGAGRVVVVAVAMALLLWWWSRTIESAMLGATSGSAAPSRSVSSARLGAQAGAVASLFPRPLRGLVGTGVFGAVLARESRFWWRDPRRRASLLSILIASAVLPIALNFSSSASSATAGAAAVGLSTLGFSFAITMSGTMGGMLLANQFAFDGNAFAAHVLAQVPGRVELRARAAAIAMMAIPVQLVVIVAVAILAGSVDRLPTGFGLLATSFGASVAICAVLSVLAPYALPENANPFAMNSGGGSAKGVLALFAMIGTLVLSVPVVVASFLLAEVRFGTWIVLLVGIGYGAAAVLLGTYIAGDLLERRRPEVLIAVTPRR